jgi:hypothetical protein
MNGSLSMTEWKSAFQPYPNPTTDRLWLTGLEENLPYTILDASGRARQKGLWNTAQGITTKTLSSGVYFLQIHGQGSPILFIKQ